MLVNWCPALGTVLANEEVIDGKSERGDHPVERIPLRQWVLKVGGGRFAWCACGCAELSVCMSFWGC